MASQGQDIDLNANRQPALYGTAIAVYVLAVVAVGLRLYSRKVARAGFWWDDWLIGVALVLETGWFAEFILELQNGLGRHYQLYIDAFPTFMKLYVSGEIVYISTNVFAKFSLLAFYWRIFAQSSNIRLPIYVVTAITFCWWISLCRPVSFAWDKSMPDGKCIDLYAFFIAILVVNFLTDVAVVTLPLRYIMRLHRSPVQKLFICAIFLLAGFVCIISIIRLVILVNTNFSSPDLTWNSAEFDVWCIVETSIGIVGACLPNLGPIVSLITPSKERATQSSFKSQDKKASGFGTSTRPSQHETSRWDSNSALTFPNGEAEFYVQLGDIDHDRIVPTRREEFET